MGPRADFAAERWGRLLLGSVLLSSVGMSSCTAGPLPCRSPVVCASGKECLANRCLPTGAEPVPPGGTRIVLEPLAVAVIRQRSLPGDLPNSVTLGGPAGQSEQLLVRFPDSWAPLRVEAAFLLLQPATDADPTGPDVELSVSLAGGSWESGLLERAPSDKPPTSRGLARTRPPALLRVDVSDQLRALQQPGANDHGFFIRAVAEAPRGATYWTGAAGAAPRLDIYGSSPAHP